MSRGRSGSDAPGRRSIAKWALSLATVLLLSAFGTSLWYHITIRQPNSWRLEVSGGAARLNWDAGPPTAARGPTQFDSGKHSAPFELWPRSWRRVGWPGVILPLWLPLLCCAVPAVLLWLPRARAAGVCSACGYDLRGLAGDANCPECGRARGPEHRQ